MEARQVATDERNRLGEKLGDMSRAAQNEWASKSDRALLARLGKLNREMTKKAEKLTEESGPNGPPPSGSALTKQ